MVAEAMSATKYCDDPDNCTYSDCPTAFCDRAGYVHPTTLQEFEIVYRKEYDEELASCDRWIMV